MATWGDDFQSGTDGQAIESRTPTGANAGTAWAVGQVGSPAIIYRSASKLAVDNNVLSGNRYRMTDDLGSDQMDVEGDFSFSTDPVGLVIGVWVLGRKADSTSTDEWEFGWEYTGTVGRYVLTDNGTNTVTLVEAWPGGTVTLKLEIRNGTIKGYSGGVEKLSVSANTHTGQTRAGLALANFAGATAERCRCARYLATGITASGGGGMASAHRSMRSVLLPIPNRLMPAG